MIDNKIYQLAYKLNEELLGHINQRNLDALNSNYEINAEVFEEIQEILNDVGIDLRKNELKISGKLRDIFEYNDGGYGIEADLITTDQERTDLTLITKLNKVKNGYKLEYKLIEVM